MVSLEQNARAEELASEPDDCATAQQQSAIREQAISPELPVTPPEQPVISPEQAEDGDHMRGPILNEV